MNRWTRKMKDDRGYGLARNCMNCDMKIDHVRLTPKFGGGFFEKFSAGCIDGDVPVSSKYVCNNWKPITKK